MSRLQPAVKAKKSESPVSDDQSRPLADINARCRTHSTSLSSRREASNSLPISDSGLIAGPDASGACSPSSSGPAGGGEDAAEESGELGATDINDDFVCVLT